MHSLEAELRELHAARVIDAATASRASALDAGAVFSLFDELQAAIYAAVLLITTGAGLLLKQHLDHIGPITILAVVALAAGACYASAIRNQLRGAARSIVGDYVLLLGALLLSADVGYGETQFHWFGAHWSLQLLLLAAVHALTAYALDSRLVLSVSLTSLAAWIGVEPGFGNVFAMSGARVALGSRSLECAALVLLWGGAHRRLAPTLKFADVFDHFAANLAFWAALAWCLDGQRRAAGLLLALAFAAVSIWQGLRSAREAFVVYGIVYGALGLSFCVWPLIRDPLLSVAWTLAIVVGAATALWQLHARLRAGGP